ncbi:hypothetical protein RhiirA1_410784 [Rhizophagus irregularis]|uniref:Uncharacterized protein n=2 Tax=Rhizophagus irregularis TaxID=588596 RepID=U9TAA8_RHIID|nr:hypothetical protein GLOIN_2v1534145 [Rhizophagus irregularis DAOM 181602=DAOM 197198]PKC73256.1 hypothetical protein RhiirA1_410784 [Rhizophagus irregularis]POG78953.1 hypothetical protein GLOIN_2v1534145 [Rhizophagus irregularis DAOM 181602=DAOM 197198]CAG8537385.1 10986_t:CDS:10 [Rhizophagus irregularis]|eukprot:XP_025185819.1 hypothetical protein GLOIN_2v1534145 [Rhizophagus irregularis DAOM 181602=DAOM 197198]
MNTNNDNLSDKEKLLDTNAKTTRKQNQWTINDLKVNIDSVYRSPYSSTGSLVISQSTDNQDESLISNNDNFSEIRYKGSNISSSARRGSLVLSDSESDRSLTLLTPPNVRRRALSATSRPKDRFSMLEFGSSKIDDVNKLSPTRHSMAFDNGFNINNKMIKNSLEDREIIDRVRIGNAGKGFGNLINNDGEKGSIADLIADVKDEDAVKLAMITQKHAGQKNRMHNTETDIEKSIAQKDGRVFSEATITNSTMCKQFLENKYHILFKIINNNGVYNPLTIVKIRKNDLPRDGSDHSLGSSENSSWGNSRNKIKSRGSLPRHKESNIWNVSHMEIIKDYEQKNKFDQIHPSRQFVRDDKENFDDDKDYPESESDEIKKRQKYLQLSQMFNPPTTQEMMRSREKEEKESNDLKLKEEKHSLSSNSTTSLSQGKEDSYNKSKKWSIHFFKRKDRKHKNKSSLSNIGIIQVSDDSLGLQTNAKHVSETSSGDQTPRSSLEDSTRQIDSEDIMSNSERMHYESSVSEEKHNYNRTDDLIDDVSSQVNSLDGHSNKSSTRSSVNLEPDDDVGYSSRQNIAESSNIGDHYDKFIGDEHEDNHFNRLSSENKVIESSGSEDEYEDETTIGLVGETVLVNLDILPQELVNLVHDYQEHGIVDRNIDNGRFVELDIGLNENFKFRKLISYGVDLLVLQISLVSEDVDIKSLSQQDADEIIKRCDDYSEYIDEAIKFLENYEIQLSKREDIIKDNIFKSIDILMKSSNILESSFDVNQQSIAENKKSIKEEIKLLNNKLVNIEDTVNKLEGQHISFTEKMEITLSKIENMTLEVNNDYFNDLKILEDEIQLIIAEREKSPWLDVFYLMMSYVITVIMIMYWFVVACFKLFKKILLVPCKMVEIITSSNSSH